MRKRRSDYDSDGLDELLAAQGVEMIAPNRWLTKVSIKERIAELKGRAAEKCDMTREQTVSRLQSGTHANRALD